MSGKDKRPPPDTGGGSHIEESTKGATSSGRRVLPSVVATLSGRRVLPNVGRSSDVEETDRKFDEAACSDNHQTSSSRADSSDSNLKGKKKGDFISVKMKTFSSEQTTDTQHQLKQKTHLYEKGEKKKQYPEQGKNEPKVCLSNLEEQGSRENVKIHVNKNVEGFSTSASAGKCVKGENLSKSFVVVNSDGEDEIELNVEMGNQDSFSVSVGLNDTVEAVMSKIEEKTGIFCENQRLVKAGKVLLKTDTLLFHGIDKDATIHLVVKTENDADKAKGDSSSGLESNPTEVPDTSNNPESKDKRDAMENNRTEETDPSCSSQQDSTENGNGASQIEKSEPRIPNSPSPTPTSDIASKYLQGEQGNGMLTHPKDSQMKEKVMKSQQLIPDCNSSSKSAFMKSYKESTTKVEKLTTKVSDDGSGMNQEKADTEIEIEGEMKVPQTPETEGEMKIPLTPDTEGEKKTPQTPDTEGDKDTKDDLNVLKMDKDPDVDVDDDDQQCQLKFENDFNVILMSTENLKELLQKDDRVQLDSSSHSSESSVESIPYEDLDESRDWGSTSFAPFNMSSVTHVPDDKEKDLKLDTLSEETSVCPLQRTDRASVHKIYNAAKIPQTQFARGEEENKVSIIQKVGNSYLLKRNNLVVKVPQLEGASGVSVNEDIILIDNEPIYDIEINNGKVKISKIGDAECEVNRSDNNSTNNSGNKETGLYDESQQPQNVEEESDMKKVRGTSRDMQNVLNPPKENETNPLNHQDTVADIKHTGSFDADLIKEGGKKAFDAPGEQQQSLEEAVYKDEKRPKPTPRSKNKDSTKIHTAFLVSYEEH